MIAVGPLFSETRTLSQADFDLFAEVSCDDNPIHVDADFSARTRFGRTVSHGMLLYTVLWGLMRKHFPGACQTGQTLMFPAPAFAGEPLVFSAMVEDAAPGTARLSLRIVRAGDGEAVCEASANLLTGGGDEGR
jgi:3-hydroxybutyryl-CoA dehydratase